MFLFVSLLKVKNKEKKSVVLNGLAFNLKLLSVKASTIKTETYKIENIS